VDYLEEGSGIMRKEKEVTGEIRVLPKAIAHVARDAALQSYGVVGFADRNFWYRIRNWFTQEDISGVRVRVKDGQIILDLYIVVQYGTRISEVAQGVMNRVKYAVEKVVGVPVAEINVHVRGLRVNHDTE